MAGSFNHIIDRYGKFRGYGVENDGDAYEALEECYLIILKLVDYDFNKLAEVMSNLKGVTSLMLPKVSSPKDIKNWVENGEYTAEYDDYDKEEEVE